MEYIYFTVLSKQDFLQKIAVSDHFWIGLGKMEGVWKWIGGTITANGWEITEFNWS